MPEMAIAPVARICHGNFPAAAGEGRYHCDYLLFPDTRLQFKLVVPDTGVGFPNSHDPVQYKLSVVPAVEGNIVFLKPLRNWGKHHGIHPLPQHRHHAGTLRRNAHTASKSELLSDQGQQLPETVALITQGIHCH